MTEIDPTEYPRVIKALHQTCNEMQQICDEKDAKIAELEAVVAKQARLIQVQRDVAEALQALKVSRTNP